MVGIRHQRMASEMLREHALARGDRLLLRHLLEAPRVPGLLRALDDHGRRVGIELVGVDPHPAVFGLLEDEGERVVELLVRSEPDELARARVDVRAEHVAVLGAHDRVDAVARHDEVVVVPVFLGGRERGLEPHLDAQLAGAVLQDLQHPHAPDAREAVAARHGAHSLVDHGDVVPVREVATNRSRALRVVALHVAERVVGQHDTPAERGVGGVALEQRHLVTGIAQLHRDREVQAGRTTTQAKNPHRRPKCVITVRILQARNILGGAATDAPTTRA